MSEREQHIHILLVIITIAYKDSFPVFHNIAFPDVIQVGRIVGKLQRECLSQLCAWIDTSEQDIHGRTADCLSAKISFQNAFYVIYPWHFNRRTVVQYNNCIRLYLCHFFDQFILAVRHSHMRSVKAFRFKCIRKSCKDDCCLCFFRSFHCFCDQLFIDHIFCIIVALCICDICHTCHHIHGTVYLMGIDVAAATALESRLLCKFTDECDLVCFGKRKDAIIFQKHDGLLCYLSCHFMILVAVKYSRFITIFHKTVYNIQNSFHCFIQHCLIQPAFPDCLDDQGIIDAVGSGHFQIQSSLDTFYSVVDCAPVTDYITVKAPFITQDVCQKLLVLRCICSVDPVVGAHHCPWLCMLYRTLKSCQIDFPHGALIDPGIGGHTSCFLIICHKMLDGSTDMPALYSIDLACRDLCCQIRIF